MLAKVTKILLNLLATFLGETKISIYCTGWEIALEMHPPFSISVGRDETYNSYWAKVYVQYVPGHIGHPDNDYETDPYADFLPPISDDMDKIRAAVILLDGFDKKDCQRYISPLMTLSRQEYEAMTWQEMLGKIYNKAEEMLQEKLRQHAWVTKKEETLFQLALKAFEASGNYITALRQYIYSRAIEHHNLKKLDELSATEWPLRERTIAEIKQQLNKDETNI